MPAERDIEKIEVNLLHPGSPPEYLREPLRTITAKEETDKVMAFIAAVAEGTRQGLVPSPEIARDGVAALEFLIHRSDGGRERHIVTDCSDEVPGLLWE